MIANIRKKYFHKKYSLLYILIYFCLLYLLYLLKMLKLKVGETGTFNCKPQNGISSTVTYSTYNSSICTITQQGVVTAKAVGYGTVAARLSDGQIITCTVEVTN